jgi:hypothetical protein
MHGRFCSWQTTETGIETQLFTMQIFNELPLKLPVQLSQGYNTDGAPRVSLSQYHGRRSHSIHVLEDPVSKQTALTFEQLSSQVR